MKDYPKWFYALLNLTDKPRPACDYTARFLGEYAKKGWVNIVDGWVSLTPIGRANVESCNTTMKLDE